MSAQEFEARARARLAEAKRARDVFVALPTWTSFGDVILAFDRIRRPLDVVRGPIGLYSQVHPGAEEREVAQRLEQELAAFETDLSLDREVYERLARLSREKAPGPVEQRLFEHAVRDYRRSGVDRDDATRQRLKELSDELVRIGQEFDLNIVGDTRSIRIPEGRRGLEGLPADYIAAHPEDESGAVTITTDPPDFVPFLCYAKDARLRHALYREYINRAAPKNLDVLGRMLSRRHEMAQLLGYPSFADYVTEDKMVRSARAAREFIERTAELARPRAEAEYREILERKRRDEPAATDVGEWEKPYWIERIKAESLGFDSQDVRPYFAYSNVRDGVLSTSASLYQVEFVRNDDVERWHESVECYDVYDRSDRSDGERGRQLARLFLDMHPRPHKYKHAALFHLRTGIAGECLPEAALVCNFAEPKNGDAGLLQHRQVTTFFHEFGHLLHHLFGGGQRYLQFSGIATEWDFVEVPSQMYEEWGWDAEVLARFAKHHQTGEPIPAGLVARMRGAEEYGKGLHVAQQMYYAALALTYHDRDPAGLDLTRHMVELKARMTPFRHEEDTHFQCSFGHLHGYNAIYYTYMWSHVIAKDLFTRFEDNLLDSKTAAEYRRTVLAPGGSKDAAQLVHEFLGRDYALAAWERWLNH